MCKIFQWLRLQHAYEAADSCWRANGCVVGGEVGRCQGPHKSGDEVYDSHPQRWEPQGARYVQPKSPQGDDGQCQLDGACSADEIVLEPV